VKEEYLNPTGSHYDRVFFALLGGLEREDAIHPGQELVETTSGNAGASFAWLCTALGFNPTVLIPEDMPPIRLAHLQALGAKVVGTPRREYVAGTIQFLRKYLRERKQADSPVYCTNHAESEHSICGMREAGREIVQQLGGQGVTDAHYYISALGGGINLRGVAEVLSERWPNLGVIGVEPWAAPDNYIRLFPGRFEETFKIPPTLSTHELLGIGRWGDTSYRFPHIEKMLGLLQDIILIRDGEWRDMSVRLRDQEAKHVGHTSAACLAAALQLAETTSRKNFVIMFYDPAWKYL
jgi:cysteine synthase A